MTLRYTNLVQANDLSVRLLNLPELGEEIPEARLGNDIVRSEDAHAIELRCRVGIGRQMASDDLVLLEDLHRVGCFFLQAACWATGVSAVLFVCVPD